MLKLHLGCGKRNFGEDWRHIDIADFPHIDSHDVTKLPYVDNSVDLIYSSHLIAYFDREEIVPVLQEWYRVMKPGGIVRIATPDFRVLCKLFVDGVSLDSVLGPVYGKMNGMYHKTTYDYASLGRLLAEVGFVGYCRYDHWHIEHPNTGNRDDRFDDHSAAYINGTLISLNIEALKP